MQRHWPELPRPRHPHAGGWSHNVFPVAVDDERLRVRQPLDGVPLPLTQVPGLAATLAEVGIVHVRGDDDVCQAEAIPDDLLRFRRIV